MASKNLSKTDLSKKAVVLTESLSRVLHQQGVFPSMGGDGLSITAVKVYSKNSKTEILATYYASLRQEDRPIEERFWNSEFAEYGAQGDEFVLDFAGGKFVLEVRPPG